MHGQEVRARIDLIDARGFLDAKLAVELHRNERIDGDHAHPKTACPRRDELADPPEAEDPQALLVELDAGEARAVPAPLAERGVRLRDASRQREQQSHRVLGGRDDVRLRCVGDDDATSRRRSDIDVVDPDPGPGDDDEPLAALDQLGGQLRRRANQDRVELTDPPGQLLDVPVETRLDIEVFAQQRQAGLADVLTNKYPQAHASASSAKSMQLVSARTSSGSIAGNIAMRSWLRPSLR